MKYICNHCGRVFDDHEMMRDYDKGTGHYDESCPTCGNEDFEEAVECAICGEIVRETGTSNGVCFSCIRENAVNIETVSAYGGKRTQMLELNGVLASAFSRSDVEALLWHVLKMAGTTAQECKRFAMDDAADFADYLKDGEDE